MTEWFEILSSEHILHFTVVKTEEIQKFCHWSTLSLRSTESLVIFI